MNNKIKLFLVGGILVTSLLNGSYLDPSGNEFNNPVINGVEAKFNQISTLPYLFPASIKGVVPAPKYTISFSNLDFPNNHFQGISRLAGQNNENYFVVSGSNLPDNRSEFFIIKENPTAEHFPSFFQYSKWEFKKNVAIDSQGYWHAGGIQVAGKYLVVPIEGEFSSVWKSKVVFYDVLDPENPQKLNVEIDRPSKSAGSAALTRLDDGHFLVAVWEDRDPATQGFDFYKSIDTTIESGFNHIGTVHYSNGVKYQSIQFVLDVSGAVYIIGTANSLELVGSNNADLLEVSFLNDNVSAVTLKNIRILLCTLSNFHAGVGIYIPDCESIHLYSCGHYILTDDWACRSLTDPARLYIEHFGTKVFF